MVKKLTRRGQKATATRKMTNSIENWKVSENQVGPAIAAYTPEPILTLCGQLEDAIMLLEVRISNSIAKINSLM